MSNTAPGPGTGAPSTLAVPAINTYVQKDTAFIAPPGTPGTPTWVTYAEVTGSPGFSGATDTKETTSHSSPDAFKRFVPTLLSLGEINWDLNFIPTDATHNYATGLQGDWVTRALIHLRLTYPDNPVLSSRTSAGFYGYIVGFEVSAPVDGFLMAKVKFKPTAAPIFSA